MLQLLQMIGSGSGSQQKLYADDVFSTYLYTGNGSTQTINNGIDLAGEGGLVWEKSRISSRPIRILDSVSGFNKHLVSDSTAAQVTSTGSVNYLEKLSNGYLVTILDNVLNIKGSEYVSWTFRRAPKFFDVVTYTGNGASNRALSHQLNADVGMVMVKATSATGDWWVFHRSATGDLVLNTTAAQTASKANIPSATSSTFTVNGSANTSGVQYVAYLFATLAGVSKVSTYTGNGSTQTIDCGFSAGARFFLVKATSATGSWWIFDSVRGIVSAADPALQLNSTYVEITLVDAVDPTPVGIIVNQEDNCSINMNGVSYAYLAIA